MEAGAFEPKSERSEAEVAEARHGLSHAKGTLKHRALELAGFLLVAYLVLKLIPQLKKALHAIEHASWEWVLVLVAIEVVSETGFVFSWNRIVDPDNVLGRGGRGRRMDESLAWMQLGSGLILPGGAWGGMGAGVLVLHRFGMPTKLVTERQFNLSFLNTGINLLALVVFGVGLATGILSGEDNLLLTLLPAAVAGAVIIAVLFIARRADAIAKRLQAKHGKAATAVATVATAVEDARRLFHRGAWTPVVGAIVYLGFEVVALWGSFRAIHASPIPGFAIVLMAYIIGAIAGSLPLPAGAGAVGGVAAMLILYGVDRNAALPAVLLHQAVTLLVPVIGGAIAYAVIRRRLGPIKASPAGDAITRQTGTRG